MTEPQRTQTARWLQLRAWFDQAIDLPDAAREELLRRVRLEDAVLADELQALLEPPRLPWRLFGLSHAAIATGLASCR